MQKVPAVSGVATGEGKCLLSFLGKMVLGNSLKSMIIYLGREIVANLQRSRGHGQKNFI